MAISPHEHTGHRLAAGWQPVDDWTTLTGSFIEVHQRGKILDQGTVDSVTDDGTILWLAQEGAWDRRIIEKLADTYARTMRR